MDKVENTAIPSKRYPIALATAKENKKPKIVSVFHIQEEFSFHMGTVHCQIFTSTIQLFEHLHLEIAITSELP